MGEEIDGGVVLSGTMKRCLSPQDNITSSTVPFSAFILLCQLEPLRFFAVSSSSHHQARHASHACITICMCLCAGARVCGVVVVTLRARSLLALNYL